MSTKASQAAAAHSAQRLHSASSGTGAATPPGDDKAQLAIVHTEPKPKPATQTGLPNAPKTPARRTAAAKPATPAAKPAPAKGTAAKPSAAKPAPAAAAKPKPAPKPKGPSKTQIVGIIDTYSIRVWADAVDAWAKSPEAKAHPEITTEMVRERLCHRAAYQSPLAQFDPRLGKRHLHNS